MAGIVYATRTRLSPVARNHIVIRWTAEGREAIFASPVTHSRHVVPNFPSIASSFAYPAAQDSCESFTCLLALFSVILSLVVQFKHRIEVPSKDLLLSSTCV